MVSAVREWRLIIAALVLSSLSGFLWAGNAQDTEVVFSVPYFPPYVTAENDDLTGDAVDIVERLMASTGLRYRLVSAPNYGRAMVEMRTARADGFFPATRNENRDELGQFFPLPLPNPWCWFFLSESAHDPESAAFRRTAIVGTLVNTNTHRWLSDHGYQVVGAHTPSALMSLFFSYGRLDAVMVSRAVFERAAEEADIGADRYHCERHSSPTMGIYLSHEFIARHPHRVSLIERAIAAEVAASDPFSLLDPLE